MLTEAETIYTAGNAKQGQSFRLKVLRPVGKLDLEAEMVGTVNDKWIINYRKCVLLSLFNLLEN